MVLSYTERKYLRDNFNHTKIKNYFFIFASHTNQFVEVVKLGSLEFPTFDDIDYYCMKNACFAITVACFLEKEKEWYKKPLKEQIDDIFNEFEED